MAKFRYQSLSSGDRSKLLKQLAHVLVTVKKEKNMALFLEQLLTPSEIVMISRRLGIAQKLVHGESYLTIRQELGVGLSTIQSVDRWLKNILANYTLPQQKKVAHGQNRSRHARPRDVLGTFADIRHRYPLEYLFLNLLLGDYKK